MDTAGARVERAELHLEGADEHLELADEHYRPKAEADRRPGSHETHGYHWLAFTWSNLYFSCPDCNRSYKRTRFPLEHGSIALKTRKRPPGQEIPLL
ncbi:MAG TPA: hypothetical protein PKA58_21505, partial [Polyangium sp.]|nr:hypothetical protein [Polyangium sp.]